MGEIRELIVSRKITTVMVTHHRLEAVKMTNSICYMEDGEIIKRETIGLLNKRTS
jgi:ABC-type Fe3+/spermidine/putrescine transport system ATPase subunit